MSFKFPKDDSPNSVSNDCQQVRGPAGPPFAGPGDSRRTDRSINYELKHQRYNSITRGPVKSAWEIAFNKETPEFIRFLTAMSSFPTITGFEEVFSQIEMARYNYDLMNDNPINPINHGAMKSWWQSLKLSAVPTYHESPKFTIDVVDFVHVFVFIEEKAPDYNQKMEGWLEMGDDEFVPQGLE